MVRRSFCFLDSSKQKWSSWWTLPVDTTEELHRVHQMHRVLCAKFETFTIPLWRVYPNKIIRSILNYVLLPKTTFFASFFYRSRNQDVFEHVKWQNMSHGSWTIWWFEDLVTERRSHVTVLVRSHENRFLNLKIQITRKIHLSCDLPSTYLFLFLRGDVLLTCFKKKNLKKIY